MARHKRADIIKLPDAPAVDLSKPKEPPVGKETVIPQSMVWTGSLDGRVALIFDALLPGHGVPLGERYTMILGSDIGELRKIASGIMMEADKLEEMANGPTHHQDA